jgi:hypothetical protein
VAWLARECVERTVDEYDAVFVITGEEGVSKSMLALEFVLEVAKLTGRPWTWDDLCYDGESVLRAYQRGHRSEAVWYDEATRDMYSDDTFELDQRALVRGLTLLREKGIILVLCLPSIFLLAKKIRGRRATYWAHVESRGTRRRPAESVAILHERDHRLRYRNDDNLALSRSERCPELRYDPLAEDDPALAAYRATKGRNLEGWVEATLEELRLRDLKRANDRAVIEDKAAKRARTESS